MTIIPGRFRCPVILKTGPAKGVPLEQLILEAFAQDFIKRIACLRGLVVLRKSSLRTQPQHTNPQFSIHHNTQYSIQYNKSAETLQVCL